MGKAGEISCLTFYTLKKHKQQQNSKLLKGEEAGTYFKCSKEV